ncbi:YbjN domain-containing protein [Vallicoccus soli]|uniref:YbjN domain-containing protein n=1 Tax=Vallicoccus soli TaxID=2339232 RepID=A0A3A3Z484_9ACTN|nr:YbjN domain-containing protein [Vallicoccus soli]RJK97738.1 YbjN domain-containing protein [Vallicoccus soli]
MPDAAGAAAVLRGTLAALGVEHEEVGPGRFAAVLPGEARLRTTCLLEVGRHALSVRAFVARRPDEAHAEVHRMLLERNARAGAVAFALDAAGDVWLVGRLPLVAVVPEVVDGLLGEVLEASDGTFNAVVERGFASAVRREWAWRERRGEPTANLEAFRRLRPAPGEGA